VAGDDETAKRFYRTAMDHMRRHGGGCVVKRGTPEFKAWWEYFEQLGWRPYWMALVNRNGGEVTMPARWPRDFDTSAPASSERVSLHWQDERG
jgi:hypothetical protein